MTMIDTACSRCGATTSPLYLYIEGVGVRCAECEAQWRERLARWRGIQPKGKPVLHVVRERQEVLL